jgi:hypothetical protein
VRLPILFALLTFSLTLGSIDFAAFPESESDNYLGYAAALVRGQGYRNCPVDGYVACEGIHGTDAQGSIETAYRLPVYPLWLGAQMGVVGEGLPPLRIMNCLLAAALVCLTVGYARRYGERAAFVAGVVMLVNPMLYESAGLLQTEMLFAVLLILLLWRFSHLG